MADAIPVTKTDLTNKTETPKADPKVTPAPAPTAKNATVEKIGTLTVTNR